MVLFHHLRRLFLFLVPVFFLTSCSLIYTPKSKEDFSQEAARLGKMIQEEKDPSARGTFHLQLAWLYSNHKNPQKDYLRALREFETYSSLVPDGAKSDEIQNWLFILRFLDGSEKELRQMRERIASLSKENAERKMELEQQMKKIQKMQGNIEKLQESNASLKKTIESLKTLDLQIEKKRKSVK